MKRHVLILTMALMAGLFLMACGSAAEPTPTPTPTTVMPSPTLTATDGMASPTPNMNMDPSPTPMTTPMAPSAAHVMVSSNPDLGPILVDGDGRTLYLYTKDELKKSNCSGGCLQAWPPLLTTGAPVAGDGVAGARLGTITLSDGSTQVTYDGWPLYYYVKDSAPGDTAGQNVGGVWFVLSPWPTLAVPLHEQNISGQTGVAMLISAGNKTGVVLQATAGISQANHIHSGNCDMLGSVVNPLTNMADGLSITILDTELSSLQNGDFAINLHKAGAPSVYTACGDIPTEADTVVVPLNEQNMSGQTGAATLIGRGDKTDVVLLATAGVSQANHIHSGSCMALGGVAHPLTNMTDGVSVTTLDMSLDSLLTGGFAINLHKAGDPSVYTACGDIPAPMMAPQSTPTADDGMMSGSSY